jgi:hypothetical protein
MNEKQPAFAAIKLVFKNLARFELPIVRIGSRVGREKVVPQRFVLYSNPKLNPNE